jgi:hypothetical protein
MRDNKGKDDQWLTHYAEKFGQEAFALREIARGKAKKATPEIVA